jgi:hypothetical protein
MELPRLHTLLDESTSTTVSKAQRIGGAEKVTLSFKRTDHSSGSAIFTVQASLDGVDYVPYVNMISNDPNNHSQTEERQIQVELGENKHLLLALDLESFNYDYIQVKVVESGSGKSTVKLLIEAC